MYQRLDTTPTPDVDLMMSVLCDARSVSGPCSVVASNAAVDVLTRYGVPARLATVKIVTLNRAAVAMLPSGRNSELAPSGSADRCDLPWVRSSGGKPHTIVNVDGTLLALALDEFGSGADGLNPQAGFFDVPNGFWEGESAIFLAGDDGSAMFMWATPEVEPPPANSADVRAESERLRHRVRAVGHRGWSAVAES